MPRIQQNVPFTLWQSNLFLLCRGQSKSSLLSSEEPDTQQAVSWAEHHRPLLHSRQCAHSWRELSLSPLWCIIVIPAVVVINHCVQFPNRWAHRHSSLHPALSFIPAVLFLSCPFIVFGSDRFSTPYHLFSIIFASFPVSYITYKRWTFS